MFLHQRWAVLCLLGEVCEVIVVARMQLHPDLQDMREGGFSEKFAEPLADGVSANGLLVSCFVSFLRS